MKNSLLLPRITNNSCKVDYNKQFLKMVRNIIMLNDDGGG